MKGDYKINGLENPAFDKNPTDLELKNGINLEKNNENTPVRAQWSNATEFLMSCIAMSVGLGNIWRFPFVANRNGGGAFLIPYLIVLTVIGRPMYYMEMALGQFSSKGTVKMFTKLSPVLKGIAYGQLLGSLLVATYYCSLMSITLFYLFNSFTTDFPWANCQPEWYDYTASLNATCVDQNTNITDVITEVTISSSELYFRREVLKQWDDISDGIGLPEWRLTLLLLLSWVVTFLVSVRGVKSSGKAAYFLALFPYVIMITLLARALTLDGAMNGIYYFIETDWSKLLEANVWYAAITQCFFSLNVGFGSVIMLSSYNNFNHNINRDAMIITTLDTFTSLLSGVSIFGILGNLAHEMGVEPDQVLAAGGGTGLAFISYPDAISKFKVVPWLFSVLFFFMLFVLGIGSLQALQGTINTAIKDAFPNLANWIVSAGTATLAFLIGLLYVTPGGQYVLDIVDHFAGTFIIIVCAILEIIALSWLYGVDRFCIDLEFMTNKKVGLYWRICWRIIMPVFLIIIFLYFIATLQPLTYGNNKYYPISLQVFGWGILAIGVAQIIYWIAYYLYVNRENPLKEMLSKSFSTDSWCPEGSDRVQEWKLFKEEKMRACGPPSESWFSRMRNNLIRS